MNLMLLFPEDFVGENLVQITGRRCRHMLEVQKVLEGDALRVGLENGAVGEGRIISLNCDAIRMSVALTEQPPVPLPLTVLLALPRPKMLKRSLQHLTALGIKKIILVNTYRVEKSFWQSPWLSASSIQEQLILGLEQCRDTIMPEVVLEKRFKPFVEDRLPELMNGKRALVAHPSGKNACPRGINEAAVLAIGPEGGFIPYEVDKLVEVGFEPIHLGPRILRVETAVTALVSKLYD
ncbi:Ribosomal RNA small subunit methyltransferase E [invertebrate metagenome]|uniref:16S rRNA (uracil(1498)-N(3))-methyltransferase n=1 Tax=invertebrate metagenome TaxID=1711999 RepID=A0A2H9T5R6_9ZZZZ